MSRYLQISDLPKAVQMALAKLNYHRKDISVDARETISVQCSGGQGRRGYAAIVNLDTLECKVMLGSFGGANMFNPNNAVDLDDREHAIPVNGAVIRGYEGGNNSPTSASLYVNPANFAKLLENLPEVTEDEKYILACYKCLKSGAYRKEAIAKRANHERIVDGLVKRGMLARSANGATQLTTSGRNAAGDMRVS